MTNELVLIRGLPGSGKTTLARKMTGYAHYENDQYFVVNDTYRFDELGLENAIDWCETRTRNALMAGKNVVVSNPFCEAREWKAYEMMATQLGKPLRFIEATGSFINVHAVPKSVINDMRAMWEPLPTIYQIDRLAAAKQDLIRRIDAWSEYPDAQWIVANLYAVLPTALQAAYDEETEGTKN